MRCYAARPFAAAALLAALSRAGLGSGRRGAAGAGDRHRRHGVDAHLDGSRPDDDRPGLALFYAGMVRKKNVLATAMQSFVITCIVTVLWYIIGYSIAFTNDDPAAPGKIIGSFAHLFLRGVNTSTTNPLAATIPEYVFSMFQMTFAIITPALITGAFAERMKFSAMCLFMALWLIFVYCPIAHWVWAGGFLGSSGVLDFAGGTVVHINAGVAGLFARWRSASARASASQHGAAQPRPHADRRFAAVGRLVRLQCRLRGRRQRSRRHGDGQHAGRHRRCGARLDVRRWIVVKKPSVLGMHFRRGCRPGRHHAGLGLRQPDRRLHRRHRRGRRLLHCCVHMKKALGYDDALDAFGVHGVGGMLGALLTGVLADPAINSLGAGASVVTQFKGVLVTIVYTAVASGIIIYVVKAVVGLRPTALEEEEGLDITQHGEVVQ